MKKMWAGRLREPLEPGFERWQRSFPFDRRLLGEELTASRAYARALAGAGILSGQELQAILGGLGQIEKKAAQEPLFLDNADAEDIHHFVEAQLVALVGEAATKLHTGRSRNEQIATDLRLFIRRQTDALRLSLADLLEVFLKRATGLQGAAMPAYTHLQRAEPVLAAHWLLAYVEMFFRDAERLGDCRRHVNVLPLGSGAVAGTVVPLDRAALAHELGFESVSANSLDATSDRDFLLEFLHALSFVALHLSRWAEELALFATAEFGFLSLPERFSTGSSALPQKKNPDALELLRGKTGRVVGAAVTVSLVLKGLPLAYNKDLQETQEPLFEATETVTEALSIARSFLEAVQFNTEAMEAAARSGFLNAVAAAHYLVRRGVPFRRAHEIIGEAVRYCLEHGKTLESLSQEELRRFSPNFGEDFSRSLILESVLASHDVPGGTAPQQVKQALGEARGRLKALRQSVQGSS
ncbi:MAG: argininosuccinate lyase [Candidatus Acidiferrales bacterium]